MAVFEYEHLVPEVVLFVDRRCYPDWKIIRRRIDFHDLTFVVGGKADYYVNGVKHTAEAGNLIYIPPGSIREAHTYADSPMHSYAFNFLWLPPNNDTRLPLDTVTKFRLAGPLLDMIKTFNQIWMSKQPGYKMQARGQFLLILHRLLVTTLHRTDDLAPDPRIERLKAYLAENYAEDIDIGGTAPGLPRPAVQAADRRILPGFPEPDPRQQRRSDARRRRFHRQRGGGTLRIQGRLLLQQRIQGDQGLSPVRHRRERMVTCKNLNCRNRKKERRSAPRCLLL